MRRNGLAKELHGLADTQLMFKSHQYRSKIIPCLNVSGQAREADLRGSQQLETGWRHQVR